MPIHVLRPGAPAADLPEFVTQLLTSLDGHDSPIDMTKNSSTFGIEPTRLADFVRAFASTATTRSHADAEKKAGGPRRLVRPSGLLETSRRTGVRPDSVQVPGGTLSFGLPTRLRVWLTFGLQPAGHRDEAWLQRGLPSS